MDMIVFEGGIQTRAELIGTAESLALKAIEFAMAAKTADAKTGSEFWDAQKELMRLRVISCANRIVALNCAISFSEPVKA